MREKAELWKSSGRTVIFTEIDGELKLILALADTVRRDSSTCVETLHAMGCETAMITGDNEGAANAASAKAGTQQVVASMKPQDKLACIEDKKAQGVVLTMVGDGANDGPALAAAHIGIAMAQGGAALAVNNADIALMSDNLMRVPAVIALGRASKNIICQNIVFSVGVKLIAVIVALAGHLAIWAAVVLDLVSLLAVVANGFRVSNFQMDAVAWDEFSQVTGPEISQDTRLLSDPA